MISLPYLPQRIRRFGHPVVLLLLAGALSYSGFAIVHFPIVRYIPECDWGGGTRPLDPRDPHGGSNLTPEFRDLFFERLKRYGIHYSITDKGIYVRLFDAWNLVDRDTLRGLDGFSNAYWKSVIDIIHARKGVTLYDEAMGFAETPSQRKINMYLDDAHQCSVAWQFIVMGYEPP